MFRFALYVRAYKETVLSVHSLGYSIVILDVNGDDVSSLFGGVVIGATVVVEVVVGESVDGTLVIGEGVLVVVVVVISTSSAGLSF